MIQFSFLLFCWLAALAALLIFLETWFALSGRQRFTSRRASGAYGVVSVLLPMQGPPDRLERVVRSILNQSYGFIELVLIYREDDPQHVNLSQKFSETRTHIPIRVSTIPFSIQTDADRARALEQAQAACRGKWWIVLRPDVILDRFAVESILEFAGSNDFAAVALRPGVQCTSFIERLLAPSMEYLAQMIRIADNRRERFKKMNLESPFLLLHREAFEIVNRLNRMPGILNESGWNIWSYQIEGARTFEGDGSRWMWREAQLASWSSRSDLEPGFSARPAAFVAASAIVSIISVAGLIYGFAGPIDNFSGASILAFSAVSYFLMAMGYFLYARRLRAAGWFAPLWFLAHMPATTITLLDIRRAVRERRALASDSPSSTPRTPLRS
jgi:hypothetical protein